jgi:hypothetical protein
MRAVMFRNTKRADGSIDNQLEFNVLKNLAIIR